MFNLFKSLVSGKAFPRIADLERAYLNASVSNYDLERRQRSAVVARHELRQQVRHDRGAVRLRRQADVGRAGRDDRRRGVYQRDRLVAA